MNPTRKTSLVALLVFTLAFTGAVDAGEGRVHHCKTSAELHAILESVGPGDTIVLEGGRVYETDRSFLLSASGREDARITLTSEDPAEKGRYAVVTTVGQRKESDLVGIMLTGAYWTLSRLDIAGTFVPLEEGHWDINGFRLGLFLKGPDSHHNVIEDVQIHHTHNAAVAIRDLSHHNTFRRMDVHHVGEWLHEGYNAHEGEGFYIGSSKGRDQAGNLARVHEILIEDSTLGPGLLGQYVDLKYGTSSVTVRNNTFLCDEKSYNEEVIKIAGFANRIEGNRFVGSNGNLSRYIHVFKKKTVDPVHVDYHGQKNVSAPSGQDNTIVNNRFYSDDPAVVPVASDLDESLNRTLMIEGNRVEALSAYAEGAHH